MYETEPDREPTSRPTVTFLGNTYDLAALVALTTGAVVLFLCLTCGMGYYCLPLAPIVAGLIGLLSADRAADPQRTRLHSWLGIGGGGLAILLIAVGIVAYVALLIFAAEAGGYR
jgi:EamA domain-containing membrane protein RarD